MKKLSIFIVISLFILSCKKEQIINNEKYIIFNSDSTNVSGTILYGDSQKIYPNIACKVIDGQIILFDRPHGSNTLRFHLNIDVGKYNCFSPGNVHYSLVNDYIFTIK